VAPVRNRGDGKVRGDGAAMRGVSAYDVSGRLQ
jgi:hypothetical protein